MAAVASVLKSVRLHVACPRGRRVRLFLGVCSRPNRPRIAGQEVARTARRVVGVRGLAHRRTGRECLRGLAIAQTRRAASPLTCRAYRWSAAGARGAALTRLRRLAARTKQARLSFVRAAARPSRQHAQRRQHQEPMFHNRRFLSVCLHGMRENGLLREHRPAESGEFRKSSQPRVFTRPLQPVAPADVWLTVEWARCSELAGLNPWKPRAWNCWARPGPVAPHPRLAEPALGWRAKRWVALSARSPSPFRHPALVLVEGRPADSIR
jgi:hypothetical protein